MSTIERVLNMERDKATIKYNILLKLLNKILVNIGKNQITDVLDFKNINKKDIELEVNNKILDEMKVDLTNYFGSFSIILKKIKKENYILVYLKHMCKVLNFKLKPSKVGKRNGKIVLASYYYSITFVL